MIPLRLLLLILVYTAAGTALLPLRPYLDHGFQILIAAGFVLGVLRDRYQLKLLGPLPATVAAGLGSLFFALQVTATNVVLPLVQILCLLLAIRLGGEKNSRNQLQIFLLSLLLLAASTLLTLQMGYLVYLLALVLLVSSGLVLLTFVAADPDIRLRPTEAGLLGRVLLVLPTGSLLVMAGLFFLLPRTQMPLWHFLNPAPEGRVGMADRVQPGSLARLENSTEVAFRASGEKLPASQLYWRGLVFDHYDGRVWQRGNPLQGEPVYVPDKSTAAIELQIFSEPAASAYLPTLDGTRWVSGLRHRWYRDGSVARRHGQGRKAVYRLQAYPSGSLVAAEQSVHLTRVPEPVSPRLVAAAGQIATEHQGFRARLNALQSFFRDRQLEYASRDLVRTDQPIETFLFETRRGYCEYFASSFAVLLRLMDIPARLVGGYLGGTYNDFGGYYLVTEGRAHVWVEALDEDGHWVRIDPSRLAVNAAETLLGSTRQQQQGFQQLLDSLFHLWSSSILNFDFQRQMDLLKVAVERLRGLEIPEQPTLNPLSLVVLFPLIGAAIVVYSVRRWRLSGLISRYRRRVAHAADLAQLPPGLGLHGIAEQAGHPLCRRFADLAGAALYNDRVLGYAERRELQRIIGRLKAVSLVIEVAIPVSVSNNIAEQGQQDETPERI